MTDRLSLYNGALRAMGERKLASLTEDRPPRYKLDDVWDNDFIDTMLEEGLWKFAFRTKELNYSPSVSPAPFGYTHGFEKPADWIRVAAVCNDEYFANPLLQYEDEVNYLWAEEETIYVKYVSNDSQYGLDYANWPKNFTRFVEYQLAEWAGPSIMGERYETKKIEEGLNKWRQRAKSTDAQKQAAKFQPRSSWTRSRESRTGDRGKRNQLIG